MLIAFLPVGVLCPSPGGPLTPGVVYPPGVGVFPGRGCGTTPPPSLAYPPLSERAPPPCGTRPPLGRGVSGAGARCAAAGVLGGARRVRPWPPPSVRCLVSCSAGACALHGLLSVSCRMLDGCWFEPGRGKAVPWRGGVIVLGVFRVTGVGVVSSSVLVLVAGARPCCVTAVGARLLALSATTSSTVMIMRAPIFSGCARGTTGVRRRPRRRLTWPRCAPVWHRRRARTPASSPGRGRGPRPPGERSTVRCCRFFRVRVWGSRDRCFPASLQWFRPLSEVGAGGVRGPVRGVGGSRGGRPAR